MERENGKGIVDFKKMIETNTFYVDKTYFIKEWYSNTDEVTLITRPRRFGKTLTMSMLEYFFSNEHKEERYLFDNLYISKCENSEEYMSKQGEYPVINMTFAGIKEDTYEKTVIMLKKVIAREYKKHRYLLESDILIKSEKENFEKICNEKETEEDIIVSLLNLSEYLRKYTGKKTYIFIDEYDTPLQHAYVEGYWDKLVGFVRGLFEFTLKDNKNLERAVLTGITRTAKESLFSGLNNLTVVTTTSNMYSSCFGFTEEEVFKALEEKKLSKQKEKVKEYYDGFLFGSEIVETDIPEEQHAIEIYNPWSIINFLQKKKFENYWANTSSNELVGEVIQKADEDIKKKFEILLTGEKIEILDMKEEVVFKDLDIEPDTVWSLLVATGYLKICDVKEVKRGRRTKKMYVLQVTNMETMNVLEELVARWFKKERKLYNMFKEATLQGDEEELEVYLNKLMLRTISAFDGGKEDSEETEPEKFYHGLVLGLLVDEDGTHEVKSNRESGYGRYDVMMIPYDKKDVGVIFEFKVKSRKEKNLAETVKTALKQIEDKKYEVELKSLGIEKIYKYGMAFSGKECKVGKAK